MLGCPLVLDTSIHDTRYQNAKKQTRNKTYDKYGSIEHLVKVWEADRLLAAFQGTAVIKVLLKHLEQLETNVQYTSDPALREVLNIHHQKTF